jgi:hypothetical protein
LAGRYPVNLPPQVSFSARIVDARGCDVAYIVLDLSDPYSGILCAPVRTGASGDGQRATPTSFGGHRQVRTFPSAKPRPNVDFRGIGVFEGARFVVLGGDISPLRQSKFHPDPFGVASQGGAVISTISGGQREFLAERSKNSRRADSLWAGARVDVLCS